MPDAALGGMIDLAGKRALVTGGGRGIGLAIAHRLARRGAHVVIWDVDGIAAAEAAATIARSGGSAEHAAVDVGDRHAVAAAAAELRARGGRLHVLVNNAGVVAGKPLLELSDDDIERTFRVNALAHFWTLRAFLPDMLDADEGHVVSIASAAGLCGAPRLADYAATKFAAVGLNESLRLELRRRHSRVRTTVVCPYFVDTGMFEGVKTYAPTLLPILRTDDVADRVVDAIVAERPQVILPAFVRTTWLVRLFPVSWFDAVIEWLGADASMDDFVGHGGARGDVAPSPAEARPGPAHPPV